MSNNDAGSAPLERRVRPLTLEDCEHLFWLAARDFVFFSTYNGQTEDYDAGWHPAVNCNDTFYYASADACGLEPHEAKEVRAAVEQWGWAGAVAWCALKRNEEPLKQLQTEQYRAATLALRPNVRGEAGPTARRQARRRDDRQSPEPGLVPCRWASPRPRG